MTDLLTVGRIGIDLFYKGDSINTSERDLRLTLGQKYFVSELHEGIGGGGANVAAAAVRNGISAGVLGLVGNNPFKPIILDKMKDLGISTEYCQITKDYLNISSIFVMANGERTIVDYEAVNKGDFIGESKYPLLEQTKAVYLASLPDISLSERVNFLKYAKSKGKFVVVNLGVRDHQKHSDEYLTLLENADMLIMNKTEFGKLSEKPETEIDLEKPISSHLPTLTSKIIVITDGGRGSYGYIQESVLFQPAIPVDRVIDTTGAGDAYTGALLAEYLKSKDLKKAMEKGSQHASVIISKVGAN
ncbi:hypothetical protein A3G67_03820 [Candidatus Roizmanbacteria bacterium RIFCSPLOWO2_12_FULL_40_12]|uniref:Carbohydrate kinase PfkB domain-containing protein n=1 Tax=Candidatus Roizmanbacteria bacterium RIFCSPLOWO2_01_FULL_40_42 TaxID=1802066 RepID=A0A1F7J5S7_9BACT|nr:MAG: hypothetical protein A2779_03455 [Candidatus Roizmanbacteria bacterium RIFCSPHIGHO2_01_FULL_40_98]OGK28392.1 MAG: hypothetical protein A3C31_00820 [Candidatus Roizmanbacteria bacterium RIFCSPHIGHO2_02_FULL_40_53]OGK30628.1 MAG: hypothetical protein A2W49_03505 [Candidatus Roizmanbacteria bacterium RIFCSPHIGHO2_12_41_18]OGK35956.1 MAG: hypothetical protein A3E69_03190 [Candidatus Roizmanbacteria bacterium RIFCSPHIGHO2_12_FULL_40_130]OGK50948.1 MAG: hypothetical protein A3B50_01590 [Candi